jgi:xanthine/CO dehydrogenase XdhC/CoxF family maturation factor
MLINDSGETAGAVSGGCVEKEIKEQSRSVLITGKAKIMTYDGRLRVGCEGLIYLLLEPIFVSDEILNSFNNVIEKRQSFKTDTYYYRSPGEYSRIGSLLKLGNNTFSLNPSFQPVQTSEQDCFSQTFPPIFQLHIFGAEHDAVQLCIAAHLIGWEVTIVASPDEAKSIDYFPGADRLISPAFNNLDTSLFDEQTAIVLMSHSFNKDVQYMIALRDAKTAYFGLLGPKQRRERLISTFLDYYPDTSPDFFEQLHGPAGINIGAENASEIAVSIIAEILSTIRNQKPIALKDKAGSIHG